MISVDGVFRTRVRLPPRPQKLNTSTMDDICVYMKTVELNCANCGCTITKLVKEYNRRLKQGKTEFFCNRKCATTKSNKDNPRPGNISSLSSGNRRDEFTPFRWFILRAQHRNKRKGYGCDITIDFLKNLWDHQAQTCPFTGWTMILPQDSNGWKEYHPTNASVDRIDNSKGYIQGNVRFVCIMANLARQDFTDRQVINFCRAVVKRNIE